MRAWSSGLRGRLKLYMRVSQNTDGNESHQIGCYCLGSGHRGHKRDQLRAPGHANIKRSGEEANPAKETEDYKQVTMGGKTRRHGVLEVRYRETLQRKRVISGDKGKRSRKSQLRTDYRIWSHGGQRCRVKNSFAAIMGRSV